MITVTDFVTNNIGKMEWIIFISAISNLILGIISWSAGKTKRLNIFFALFCLTLSAVGFLDFFFRLFFEIWFLRGSFALSALMPVLGIMWIFELEKKRRLTGLEQALLVVTGLTFFSVAFFSDHIVEDVQKLEAYGYRSELGFLFSPYVAYITLAVFFAIIKLFRMQANLSGIERLRVRYLMTGICFYAIGALLFSLVLPFVFNIHKYRMLDSFFALVFVGFSMFAILRYRLMGIRMASRYILKAIYIFLAAVFLSAVFFVIIFLVNRRAWGNILGLRALAVDFLSVVLYLIIFHPVLSKIKHSGDVLFFSDFNPGRMLKDFTSKTKNVWSLNKFYRILAEELRRSVKSGDVSVLLIQRQEKRAKRGESRGAYNFKEIFEEIPVHQSGVFKRIQRDKMMLIRDELSSDDKALTSEMYQYEASIIIPAVYRNNLIGLVILGNKKDPKGYKQTDIYYLGLLGRKIARNMARILRQGKNKRS